MSTANLSPPRDDPLDEPPPYTPRADPSSGESTVEFGPRRPFQQPPAPRPAPSPQPSQRSTQPSQRSTRLSPQPTGTSRRGRSLWQQLTNQIEHFAEELERRADNGNSRINPRSTGTSYPGRSSVDTPTSPPTPRRVPPLPPRRRAGSSSSLPETSSDFARDFYAAGTGEGLFSDDQANNRSRSARVPQTPAFNDPPPQREDRTPTTAPVPGRPLLRDGKLLVYPKGHTCDKCFNTGFKGFDPRKPCKKCWNKFAKPFSGPLAYSFNSSSTSSNTQNINLQKPLPELREHPSRPLSYPSPQPVTYNSWHTVSQTVSYNHSPYITSGAQVGPPPPGAIIYRPGDPRIGGELCWRCGGKGTMNIIIDVIKCPICNGCGRTFL